MNYNYFNIFNYINENVDIKSNNKKLIEFYENEKLEEQTQILTEVFKYLGKHIKEKSLESNESISKYLQIYSRFFSD